MSTDHVGEWRDIGNTLLHGERQVLEMLTTGAALAAVLDALCSVIDQQSGLISGVFLLDAGGTHLTQAAGRHFPHEWRRATNSLPGRQLAPVVALFLLAFVYYLVTPPASFPLEIHDVPRIMILLLSALLVVSLMAAQRRATESLGGRLETTSGDHGTTVRARLPLVKDAS